MLYRKRIAFLLIVFFLYFSQYSFSKTIIQDTIPQFNVEAFKDSLRQLQPKEFMYVFTSIYTEDTSKVETCIDFIKKNMISSENFETQFWGYYSLAKWENYETNFKESIDYILRATEIAEKIDTLELLLRTHIVQGDFYYDFGKYKESMKSYLKAMKYAKQANHVARQLAISKNIALLKLEVGDAKGSAELLEGTLQILEKEDSERLNRLEVSIYIALVKSYMRLENYAKALYYAGKGIELSDHYGDEDAKTYFYNFLGEINLFQKKYNKSSWYLEKALLNANKIKTSQSQIPFIDLNIAKVAYYKEDYKTAIRILNKIEANQKTKKTNFFSLEDMYEFLGKSYKAIGDTEKSLFYFEKTNEVYTANDKKQNEIGLEIIKQYDLQSLKEELNQAEKKTKKTTTQLYISIFIALVIIGGLVYFYKKREKENQQKFTALLLSLEEEKQKRTVIVKEISETVTTKTTAAENSAREVEIIDETKAKLLKKLQSFEDKELFLSKNSSLNEVAKKLKTNTSYLSKLVNAHKGKSFTAYITDLRVNYAIRRLKEDRKFRSYTIDSIAREIGFNRSESFSRAFKNKTGLYPSYYIKNLDSQNVT